MTNVTQTTVTAIIEQAISLDLFDGRSIVDAVSCLIHWLNNDSHGALVEASAIHIRSNSRRWEFVATTIRQTI